MSEEKSVNFSKGYRALQKNSNKSKLKKNTLSMCMTHFFVSGKL
jgi:hypothetical protein